MHYGKEKQHFLTVNHFITHSQLMKLYCGYTEILRHFQDLGTCGLSTGLIIWTCGIGHRLLLNARLFAVRTVLYTRDRGG